jgi:hypothetical protein
MFFFGFIPYANRCDARGGATGSLGRGILSHCVFLNLS